MSKSSILRKVIGATELSGQHVNIYLKKKNPHFCQLYCRGNSALVISFDHPVIRNPSEYLSCYVCHIYRVSLSLSRCTEDPGKRRKAFPQPFIFPSEPASQFPASLIREQCITHYICNRQQANPTAFPRIQPNICKPKIHTYWLIMTGTVDTISVINTTAVFPVTAVILMGRILRNADMKVSARSEAQALGT